MMCDYTWIVNEMGNSPQRQPSFRWADADEVLSAEIQFVSVLYNCIKLYDA